MRPAAHAQIGHRNGKSQLVEKDAAHLVVVVLPRVNDALLGAHLREGARHDGGLDELRPRADDGDESRRLRHDRCAGRRKYRGHERAHSSAKPVASTTRISSDSRRRQANPSKIRIARYTMADEAAEIAKLV